ncbi:MAG: 50S ribosomal protein L24 [Bacteroidetes bacterium RIFCSPLOWO2_12_FULL_31_6]|nr:MAG: 50S ribosomal protein L24 [Bacteroidetes bacterium RIFCSPLOWO2_12_FULL_31_6]
MSKLHIKKGDTVKVIAGESKGAQGVIKKVLSEKNRALVEGKDIKKISKHTKPNAANPDGGIIKVEAPIHISNLMVIDPKTGEPTRTGRKLDENGKKVRYAKKSGEVI